MNSPLNHLFYFISLLIIGLIYCEQQNQQQYSNEALCFLNNNTGIFIFDEQTPDFIKYNIDYDIRYAYARYLDDLVFNNHSIDVSNNTDVEQLKQLQHTLIMTFFGLENNFLNTSRNCYMDVITNTSIETLLIQHLENIYNAITNTSYEAELVVYFYIIGLRIDNSNFDIVMLENILISLEEEISNYYYNTMVILEMISYKEFLIYAEKLSCIGFYNWTDLFDDEWLEYTLFYISSYGVLVDESKYYNDIIYSITQKNLAYKKSFIDLTDIIRQHLKMHIALTSDKIEEHIKKCTPNIDYQKFLHDNMKVLSKLVNTLYKKRDKKFEEYINNPITSLYTTFIDYMININCDNLSTKECDHDFGSGQSKQENEYLLLKLLDLISRFYKKKKTKNLSNYI